MMTTERIEGAFICRVEAGEWYNQRPWGMFDDDHLPAARWHSEVEEALWLQQPPPSTLVIDMASMPYMVIGDYGFLAGLSKRLAAARVRLVVVARPNAISAHGYVRGRLSEPFDMVGTLDEALSPE